MDYLASQNFPFNHLHSGNVIVDNGVCRITDVENDLINLNPKLKKILQAHHTKVPAAVASFGCLLYEMAVGYEMDNVILDDLPETCAPKIKKVLRSIFDCPEGEEVPSVHSLISNPFFSEVKLYSDWIPEQIKMGSKTKQLLQSSVLHSESIVTASASEQSKKPTKSQQPKKKSKTPKPTVDSTSNPVSRPTSPPPTNPNPIPISSGTSRTSLLQSIEGFSSTSLKKTETNDRSAPQI